LYIVIVGGGQVGYYLVKALLNENHEVSLIEADIKAVKRIEEELGSIYIHGDGCDIATLDKAGTERADIFIAVTGRDENNLVACQVAKHRFNVPRTIARISNPTNDLLFKKLGLNTTISSVNLVLEHIEGEIPTHPITRLTEFPKGNIDVVELKIPPTSPAVGKRIDSFSLPKGTIISLIVRKEREARLATKHTTIEAGDWLIMATHPEKEEYLHALFTTGEAIPAQRI